MKTNLLLILALGNLAMASYTWNGGETITTEGWKTESNWVMSDISSWTADSWGPGSNGSNMWDPIIISNASGSIMTESNTQHYIEGWRFSLTLTNSNLNISRINKFQGGCELNIDASSSLTIDEYWGGNDGQGIILNNYGSFTLAYSQRNQGGDGFTMNLFETGIVTFLDQNNSSDTNHAKVKSLTAILTGAADSSVLTRQLIKLDDREGKQISFDNTATTYSFTDANGQALTAVDSLEALQAATTDAYFITKDETGLSVSYKFVPEPTTATLSLLALAGLCARRRRK